jgi:hypothetical protein
LAAFVKVWRSVEKAKGEILIGSKERHCEKRIFKKLAKC